MKTALFFMTLILLVSCRNDKSLSAEKIIAKIESEGYTYTGECETPYGIDDTLLLGYTDRDRTTGIFHGRELRPKYLSIKGYAFEEVSNDEWKSTLMIYEFDFNDRNELRKFEAFQDFLINYQSHSKNTANFVKEGSKWFLRFKPMP